MPDTPTATTESASSGESQSAYESEFSHPVGSEDGARWDKYFGKDAPWPKEGEDRGRGKADREKPKGEKESSKTESRGTSKDSERSSKSATEKPKSDSKETSKSKSESSEKSSAKSSDAKEREPSSPSKEGKPKSSATKQPETESSDSTDATGRKTAEREEDAEPARKAKETYAKAKAEEDIPTKRKLFRQAMTEAFGEVPDEFNDAKLASIRKRHADTERSLTQQKQQNEQRIQDAVKQLQPAITVMRKVKEAGLGEYTMEQLDHAVEVMKELKGLADGDYTGLARLVSKAAKTDPEEAMKRFVRGVKVSPENNAVRAAAKAAEERAAKAEREVQELKAYLQRQQQQQQNEQQTQAQKKAQVEAKRAEYTAEVESEIEGHPVLKLPRGLERVVSYLIKTADKKTRVAKYSPTRVADAILANEQKRAAQVAALESDEDPPARSERATTPSRRETAENGVPNPDPMARFNEIYDKHAPRRAAGGRR